ncbi:hypothetical protein VTL71DRAFT_14665 [Oculimacula yallundae]|uniref:Dienelactone hydrolase domain-containing protein n=1 Tax=Oculimacula yallundae TaxID=86028 RepID=A0ABR4CJQ4_9HELO
MSYGVLQPHPLDGIQREGQPRGMNLADGGFQRYVVRPDQVIGEAERLKGRNHGVIVLADRDGFSYDNKMLADGFAAAGYATVMVRSFPVKFEGLTMSFETTMKNAAIELHRWRIKSKQLRIVLAGYRCTLQQMCIQLNTPETEKCVFVAGFIASPINDPSYDNTIRKHELTKPLSLAYAESINTTAKQLEERKKHRDHIMRGGAPYQINFYSHVREGFASRRAVASEAEFYAKKTAFAQALQWFHFHLFDSE